MRIETYLHAVDLVKFRLQWPTTKEEQQKYNRQYWAFYGGIMRRYIRLQQENASLRSENAAMEYLLSECVTGADFVNAELQGLRDEVARLRKVVGDE